MRVHLIAIGGSAMHNFALALHEKGHEVTGSDDQIFEPSRSRLKQKGLLPKEEGWDANNIHAGLDAVILGMHAKKDNPELIKALEMGIPVKSYPEFLYEQSKNKKRVVIGGSHGKTSITGMLLHVLKDQGVDCDYMVGAQLAGFDTMVRISDAPIMVIEGDEYLSSPIDLKPKFLWYKPHLAVLSGIAWDHINVFPTEEDYFQQFERFVETLESGAKLFMCDSDPELKRLCSKDKSVEMSCYAPEHATVENGKFSVQVGRESFTLKVIGDHNLKNAFAARSLALELGVSERDFWASLASFKGAAKRLEELPTSRFNAVYKDFAHAPSKVRATVGSLLKIYGDQLVAVLELHTFSSLNKAFLPQYKGVFKGVKKRMVYFNPITLQHKGLPAISKEELKRAFDDDLLTVFEDSTSLFETLKNMGQEKTLLMMSSGNWDNQDLGQL